MAEGFEPCVSELTGGHLDGQTVLLGIGFGIEVGDVKLYTQVLAKVVYEGFIAVGLLASQVEIAVGALARMAQ
jgi:hypothetical protein